MKQAKARDIVVPCTGGGHKVRLRLGRRFFSTARCPRCSGPVDPWRYRRVLAFARGLGAPASDDRFEVGLWAGAVGYSAFVVVLAVAFRVLADRSWLATVLLYGPRWILLVPLPVLLIASALRDRWLLPPLAVATWAVLGPIMGLQLGVSGWLRGGDASGDLTIVTFNVAGGEELASNPASLMSAWRADIVAIQECRIWREIESAEALGIHTSTDRLCLLSRFPILEVRQMEREVLEAVGGAGRVNAYLLDLGDAEIWLVNLHLETPRAGLELIREGRLREGADSVRQLSFLRDVELRRAADFAAALDGPRIVVGDFNTPVESRSYRRAWGSWTNAFSVAGQGLGGTRMNGWIRARIDHVLVDDSWTVVDAYPGEDVGSDHLPMIARVRLRRPEKKFLPIN